MGENITDLESESLTDLELVININEIVHSPARLAILLFLLSRKETTFSIVCKALKLTRGNLSTHLKKLGQVKLVLISKRFIDAKPTTIISLTEFGRKQILEYAKKMSSILLSRLE